MRQQLCSAAVDSFSSLDAAMQQALSNSRSDCNYMGESGILGRVVEGEDYASSDDGSENQGAQDRGSGDANEFQLTAEEEAWLGTLGNDGGASGGGSQTDEMQVSSRRLSTEYLQKKERGRPSGDVLGRAEHVAEPAPNLSRHARRKADRRLAKERELNSAAAGGRGAVDGAARPPPEANSAAAGAGDRGPPLEADCAVADCAWDGDGSGRRKAKGMLSRFRKGEDNSVAQVLEGEAESLHGGMHNLGCDALGVPEDAPMAGRTRKPGRHVSTKMGSGRRLANLIGRK